MHRNKLDDGREYAFTDHALQRLVEMQITGPQIVGCLTEPDTIATSKAHPGQENYRRGDLTLGVAKEDGVMVVVTALFSNDGAWARAFAKGRGGSGREFRPGALGGGAA